MATRIRLRRVGRKGIPFYRIVVADRTSPRDGRFVEIIGTYAPKAKGQQVTLDADKAKAWLAKGATPSDTVAVDPQEGRRHLGLMTERRAPPRGGAAAQAARPQGRRGGLPAHRRARPGLRARAVALAWWIWRVTWWPGRSQVAPVARLPPRVADDLPRTGNRGAPWSRWRGIFLAVAGRGADPAAGRRGLPRRAAGLRGAGRGGTGARAWSRRGTNCPRGLTLEVQGPKREFLLPFRKDFVRQVDRAGRRLVVDVPEGLLDL